MPFKDKAEHAEYMRIYRRKQANELAELRKLAERIGFKTGAK